MPRNNWRNIYKNQLTIKKELKERVKKRDPNLKFNRQYLTVSDIATQFYSEAKLELNYIFGRVQTEEQQEGEKLHEKMAEDAKTIRLKDLLERISKAEELTFVEAILLMKYHEIIIAGKPDVVIFKKGVPVFLFEYKFSKYSITFPNQHVQAQIYCQILKELGYNTDLLIYGIIIAPRSMTKKTISVKNIPQLVSRRISIESFIQLEKMELQFDDIKVYLQKFDSNTALKNLDWAIDYWKGIRSVEITELLSECKKHKYAKKCKIVYGIIQELVEEFSSNIISIYGIGSFFDKNLPSDWTVNDVDLICVVKNINAIKKIHDWTDVRRLTYEKNQYIITVFFNSLEGLKHKEIYEKESWANYKWALLDFKVPENSVILYGKSLINLLPRIESIIYDFEDLLRRSFYHLNNSFKNKNKEVSMNQFTKGVFKFAFLIGVHFDPNFKRTSIYDITLKINEMVKKNKIETYFIEVILECIKFRRGIPFSEDFSILRNRFISYCFYLLNKGKLWKKYEWDQIVGFCHTTYNGLVALENIAKSDKDLFYLNKPN